MSNQVHISHRITGLARGAGRAARNGLGAIFSLGALRAALVLALIVVTFGVAAGAVWLKTRPGLDALEAERQAEPAFEDVAGEPLQMARGLTEEYVPLDRMPEALPKAVVALEDRRFHDHGGIDLRSTARALTANIFAGGIVEGGSTITQQLVKISYLTPERSFTRKAHEAMLAREMERRFTKDEILEAYLNRVYLGSGARGVGAASRVYFDKSVEDLTLAEAAVLAAVIRTPSGMNPYRDDEAIRDRGSMVIDLMTAQGLIDEAAANAARIEIATMGFRRADTEYGGWFADWVERQAEPLVRRVGGPVTVRTTLDPVLQKHAEQVVNDALRGTTMQGALVALRPDGSVAAMVGGRDYDESQFNRATDAVRQPGSTFKTFVYLTALSQGLSPGDMVSDQPIEIDGYAPENFGGRFHGEGTLTEAFAGSWNAAAVRLGQHVGIDKVAEAARALGIRAELSETPSLALGASGVTLIDLTEAYAALATGRAPVDARGVAGLTTSDGAYHELGVTERPPSGVAAQLLDHRHEMGAMLQAAVLEGTGEAAAGVPGAVGKTGTSQNFRDALFVGWNDRLVVGVWVGNDDNSPMDEVTGGGLPAEIWARFLGSAPSDTAAPAPADAPAADGEVIATGAAPQDGAADPVAASVAGTAPRPEAGDADADIDSTADAQQQTRQPGQLTAPDAMLGLLERASDGDLTVGEVRALLEGRIATSGPQGCNVESCSRAYRSFRVSDCTFQPYGNRPRERCDR